MERRKITISFKEDETLLYEFLKSKRNYSVFVKDLIEEYLNKKAKENREDEF